MTNESSATDAARQEYLRVRQAHWDGVAGQAPRWRGRGRGYHRRLERVYAYLVPPGQRVLELGCGEGDLLAALQPSVGVGVDLSPAMVDRARQRHPGLQFVQGDAAGFETDQPFDAIVLSDLVNDLWDVQAVLERVARLARPETRILLNFYSHLWELPLAAASTLGLARPRLLQNWMTREDVANVLQLAGFEVVRRWHEVLWPARVPGLDDLANRVLAKTWPLCNLALANFMLARLQAPRRPARVPPRVSVIVPARNEQGNIARILDRVPEMGGGTELVFVEGHSRDDTYAELERQIAAHPQRRCKLARQTGEGKGDAVRLGFAMAEGEVLMILDADLTVVPEDLPRFYDALVSGKGEFINGVRLVYPMEKQAMRFFNLVANKFFSLAFSWLLGQSIKDTLCGTKVLWKADYERLAANRGYFGDFDPFGDYDLLFGAAKLGLRIVDLPIRYRERTYGSTQIHRWKHGVLLLRMVAFAARRMKFV